jgi:hypothetical protein
MAGANWPRYIAANVCYPAGKSASRTAGGGRLLPIAEARRIDSLPSYRILACNGRASPERLSRPLLKPFGVTSCVDDCRSIP